MLKKHHYVAFPSPKKKIVSTQYELQTDKRDIGHSNETQKLDVIWSTVLWLPDWYNYIPFSVKFMDFAPINCICEKILNHLPNSLLFKLIIWNHIDINFWRSPLNVISLLAFNSFDPRLHNDFIY